MSTLRSITHRAESELHPFLLEPHVRKGGLCFHRDSMADCEAPSHTELFIPSHFGLPAVLLPLKRMCDKESIDYVYTVDAEKSTHDTLAPLLAALCPHTGTYTGANWYKVKEGTDNLRYNAVFRDADGKGHLAFVQIYREQ
eukprot:3720223-Rhodomonas_salina.1